MSELIEHQGPTSDVGSKTAMSSLRGLLIDGDALTAVAIEHRIYALLHRRHLSAATTGRFIFMKRPLLGGFDPTFIRWQDLKEVSIKVGLFTATLTVSYSANMSDTAGGTENFQTLKVASLCKGPAQAVYRECQAQEQSWREKRRVRTMEEMRARSGTMQIATGLYPPPQPAPAIEQAAPAPAADSPTERLLRAKEMLDKGLITDSEFEAIKAKIVGGL